jgi:hypothetical protein
MLVHMNVFFHIRLLFLYREERLFLFFDPSLRLPL